MPQDGADLTDNHETWYHNPEDCSVNSVYLHYFCFQEVRESSLIECKLVHHLFAGDV
jgi:hypothetical protein